MLNICGASHFQQKACVAGEWIDADDGTTVKVTNPATRQVLSVVPVHHRPICRNPSCRGIPARPKMSQVELLWPGQRWTQSLEGFAPGSRHISFADLPVAGKSHAHATGE